MFFNYKEYYSFVLMAVVDSEYQFIFISVGSYGKECDSTILKDSTFWKKINDGTLNVPKPRRTHEELPFILVGDEGFALTPNLLPPYGGTHLNNDKKKIESRARRYVECAFGILANKWRILHRPIDLNVDTAIHVIKACTVLHNFVREKDCIHFESYQNIENGQEQDTRPVDRNGSTQGGPNANAIRTAFTNYFCSDIGSVSWQAAAIN